MSGAVGCRSARDNQIDLLERELRTQEDYIYELEDYVVEYSEKLRQTRCAQPYQLDSLSESSEPIVVPKRPSKKPVEQPVAAEPIDQFPEAEPDFQPEQPQADQPESILPEEIEIPELELDTPEPVSRLEESERDLLAEEMFDLDEESELEAELDFNDEIFYIEEDSFELAAAELATVAEEPLDEEPASEENISEAEFVEKIFEEEPLDSPHRLVERLVITDVYRSDESDQPPTTLMTVIEARDENNEPVDLDGKVSLMVMTADPESPQRLKRWDFTADETASAWQSSPLGDGLHLELPLDEEVVASAEPAELWVRLVGPDGRKLLAQLPLEWELLTPVEVAMAAGPLPKDEDIQMLEAAALPLSEQETALAEQETVTLQPAVEQSPVNSRTTTPEKPKPQWRASTQRAHAIAEEYSTTSKTAKRWTSQPTGGRAPLSPPKVARRAATASASDHSRPQWSPPKGRRD